MRLLTILWLACFFVLSNPIDPLSFLPSSAAFVGRSHKDTAAVAPAGAALAVARPEETVGSADTSGNLDPFDDATPTSAEAVPPPRRRVSLAEMCDSIASAAQSNDLPIGFLIRLIWQESGFDSSIVSRAGAQGVAQFMPRTAAEWGLDDPFDPLQALPTSARMLRSLHREFGNLGLAAAAYNAGSGRIQNWLSKRGKLPDETRSYVMNITGHPAEKWVNAAPHSISFRVPNRAPCREIAMQLDASAVPLPLPRLGPPSVTATRALDVKPLAAGHAASRDPLPKIAVPASIIAERAPANGKMKLAKVTTSGKRQQLVLSVKGAAKSPASPAPASVQVAAVTKPAKKAAAAKTPLKSPATKTASKGPLQLAMVMRSSKK